MRCKPVFAKWLSSFFIILEGCSAGNVNHQGSDATIGKSSWMSMTQRDPINDLITREILAEALNSKAYLIIQCDKMGLHVKLSGEGVADADKLKPIIGRVDAGKPMNINVLFHEHTSNHHEQVNGKIGIDEVWIPKSSTYRFIESLMNHNKLVIRLIGNNDQNLDYHFNVADADGELSAFVQNQPCYINQNNNKQNISPSLATRLHHIRSPKNKTI